MSEIVIVSRAPGLEMSPGGKGSITRLREQAKPRQPGGRPCARRLRAWREDLVDLERAQRGASLRGDPR